MRLMWEELMGRIGLIREHCTTDPETRARLGKLLADMRIARAADDAAVEEIKRQFKKLGEHRPVGVDAMPWGPNPFA